MTCRHIPSPEWEMRNENQSVHPYLVIKSILQVMIVGVATCYHGNTTAPTYTSLSILIIFRSGGQRPPERPKIVLATCVCIYIYIFVRFRNFFTIGCMRQTNLANEIKD